MRKEKEKFMGRREARETAMKLLYSIEYHRENIEYQIECFMEDEEMEYFSQNDKEYILNIARSTFEKLGEIDETIEKYSRGWAFNRIPAIDIAILRLCIYEMFNRDDIPINVSINEAVNIAKKYGHEESGTFINGILGSIYRDAIKDGKLKENL